MQYCEKCGRPMRVTWANKGEGKLLRGKMFVCEHADCEAFMLSQRPNTAFRATTSLSSATAPASPAGDEETQNQRGGLCPDR